MLYRDEHREELLANLRQILDKSDERIKAIHVSGDSVLTYSTVGDLDEELDLIDEVGELFRIHPDRLGGLSVWDIQILKDLGGYFYVERN